MGGHTVLNFSLLQELDIEEVGKAEGIEAGIAWHVRGKILRLWKERNGRGGLLHSEGGASGGGDGMQAGATKRGTRKKGSAKREGGVGNEGKHCRLMRAGKG